LGIRWGWAGTARGAPAASATRTHTVTRPDTIFRYPDRVPLTQNVHREKKIYALWAGILHQQAVVV
jgi:hypothetical protein